MIALVAPYSEITIIRLQVATSLSTGPTAADRRRRAVSRYYSLGFNRLPATAHWPFAFFSFASTGPLVEPLRSFGRFPWD